DVWFCWTSPVTGPVTLSTCGLVAGDTVLAVYPGCVCPSLATAALACNDDACDLQSAVTWTATAGSTYLLRVGSYGPATPLTGTLRLSSLAAPPANDACASATLVLPAGETLFDLRSASTDGPPLPCGSGTAHNDVWFRLQPTQTGPLVIETCGGSSIDTVLAVYENGCPSSGGTLLSCSDDACGSQSRLLVPARANTPLLVRVGGYLAGTRGTGLLRVRSGVLTGPLTRPGSSSRYVLLEPSSWSAAQSAAASLGGSLATVTDSESNQFIRTSLLAFDGSARDGWIGLRSSPAGSALAWQSGSASEYRAWAAGEPTLSFAEARFTVLTSTGTWRTAVDQRSAPATFGVVELPPASTCLADLVGIGGTPGPDGLLTGDDFVAFIAAFAAGEQLADLVNIGGSPPADGLVTGDDFNAFIAAFVAGCP
ncbi:MAG: GC-type dockerin domain-anchored protein, partial [bacterium]